MRRESLARSSAFPFHTVRKLISGSRSLLLSSRTIEVFPSFFSIFSPYSSSNSKRTYIMSVKEETSISDIASRSILRASAILARISALGAIASLSYFLILESAVVAENPTFIPNSFWDMSFSCLYFLILLPNFISLSTSFVCQLCLDYTTKDTNWKTKKIKQT